MSTAEVIRRHLLAHGKSPKAASEAEILLVLDRWARVRGFTLDADPVKHGLSWGFLLRDGEIMVWHWADDPLVEHVRSSALALAWALLVESEPPPVDVGPCPKCKGHGAVYEGSALVSWCTGAVYEASALVSWCTACGPGYGLGSGRKLTPASRLLLDATTDAAAREALDVHAEVKLRDRGDPLGELLGWALGLWTGEPSDCGPCLLCAQRDKQATHARRIGGTIEWSGACPACDGCGRQLGHPHTAAAAGALTEAYLQHAGSLIRV